MVGLLLFASRPAVGQTAYVWYNGNVRPNPDYAYNPTGGSMEILRGSVGEYKVHFAGMNLYGGNVQVTAYGNGDNRYCKVAAWDGDAVKVLCFDSAGNRSDAQFTAHFSRGTGVWGAYVRADDPTSSRYSPDPTYVYNPYGGSAEVTRLATGRYSFRFDRTGPGPHPGVVHVTAYGDDNRRCEVGRWSSGWGGGLPTVSVFCFDPAGTPADSRFTALFSFAEGASGPAYAWADKPTLASYVPRLAHNPAGAAVRIERDPAGTYRVRFPGLALNDGNVQVTATGEDARRCIVAFWSGETIHVRCFDNSGGPADARFTVSFSRAPALASDEFSVTGTVYTGAAVVPPGGTPPPNPLSGFSPEQIVAAPGLYAVDPRSMVRVRLLDAAGDRVVDDVLVVRDGDYRLSFRHPAATLAVRFQVRDALSGDIYLDSPPVTVTSGANLRFLVVGGESVVIGGSVPYPTSAGAFVFTRVGHVGVAQIRPESGLVDVPSAPSRPGIPIPEYRDAPFGGNLFLFGAFSREVYDDSHCYQVLVDGTPLSDPLAKTRYTVDTRAGVVPESRLVSLGPQTLGRVPNCYRLTPMSGPGGVFWESPDLLAIWRTGDLDATSTLSVRLYDVRAGERGREVALSPPATLRLRINNTTFADPPAGLLAFTWIRWQGAGMATEDLLENACTPVDLSGSRELDIKAQVNHPFLLGYRLEMVKNGAPSGSDLGSGGYFPGIPTSLEVAKTLDTADFLDPCGYIFRLSATARTTDGYGYLYSLTLERAYYVQP